MTAVGEAAAVTGIVVASAQTIHQGFVLLSSMRSFAKDADQFRRDLEYEFYRYFMWEEQHEAFSFGASIEEGRDPHTSKAKDIEQKLLSLMPKGEQFEARYHLKVEEIQEDVKAGISQPWLQLPSALRRKFDMVTTEAINSRNGTLKKLRWVTFDKNRAMKLAQDIHALVNQLMEMRSVQFQNVVLSILMSMIRKGVKISSTTEDMQSFEQLSLLDSDPNSRWKMSDSLILSELRSRRIATGVDATSAEQDQQATFQTFVEAKKRRSLKLKELKRAPPEFKSMGRQVPGTNREIAKETNSSLWVLLEKRYVDMPTRDLEANRRRRYQTEDLALLLSGLNSPSLHVLPYAGFYWDGDGIVFIYRLPESADIGHAPDHPPEIQSLQNVVSNDKLPKASLVARLRIACALAEVVLNLHTAGWLHKQIRPDHILLTNFIESHWPQATSFQGPHLVGYGFSRQNDPRNISDEIPEGPIQRIYRHPRAVEHANQRRDSSRPRFDLYSLGVVLLEVALWKPVKDIIPETFGRVKREESFESSDVLFELTEGAGRNSVMADIDFSAGAGFVKAIQWCLDPKSFFRSTESTDGVVDDDDVDDDIDFERELEEDVTLAHSIDLQEAVLTSLRTNGL